EDFSRPRSDKCDIAAPASAVAIDERFSEFRTGPWIHPVGADVSLYDSAARTLQRPVCGFQRRAHSHGGEKSVGGNYGRVCRCEAGILGKRQASITGRIAVEIARRTLATRSLGGLFRGG